MARTASSVHATATANRQTEHGPDLVIAMIWSCCIELWLMGKRYQALTTARGTLDSQLNWPGATEKRGYLKALARYSRWSAELQGLEMRLGPLMVNLAKHYGRLSERKRQELVSHEGWSHARDPEVFAEEMWVRAKNRMPWPKGEPPFPLEPLSDWVEACMAKARQQIADDVAQWYWTMHGLALEAA